MAPHTPPASLIALSPKELFLATLWGEARGEPLEGQVGVGWVILNRLHSGRWGDALHKVLLSWAQFSCLWPSLGGANHQKVMTFVKHIHATRGFVKVERQLEWVVEGLLSEQVMDNTKGATHYFADYLDPPPTWAKRPAMETVVLGRHSFWRGVA